MRIGRLKLTIGGWGIHPALDWWGVLMNDFGAEGGRKGRLSQCHGGDPNCVIEGELRNRMSEGRRKKRRIEGKTSDLVRAFSTPSLSVSPVHRTRRTTPPFFLLCKPSWMDLEVCKDLQSYLRWADICLVIIPLTEIPIFSRYLALTVYITIDNPGQVSLFFLFHCLDIRGPSAHAVITV